MVASWVGRDVRNEILRRLHRSPRPSTRQKASRNPIIIGPHTEPELSNNFDKYTPMAVATYLPCHNVTEADIILAHNHCCSNASVGPSPITVAANKHKWSSCRVQNSIKHIKLATEIIKQIETSHTINKHETNRKYSMRYTLNNFTQIKQ